jgi:nitrite reductase/ring-hydroxylating ferredoxin subunit
MQDVTRREFVATAVAAAACACMLGGGECAFAAEDTSKPIDAGPLADFKDEKVYDSLAASSHIYIVRSGAKLYAMTSMCTHKNKATKLRAGVITCPAHGSKFSNTGTVDKGPAKLPLVHYAISTDANGHVMVDKSKSFTEKEWDKDGSFIEVKA